MKSNLTKEHYKWLIENSRSDKESSLRIYIDNMMGFIECYKILISEDGRNINGKLINPIYKYAFKLKLLDLPFEFIKKGDGIDVDSIEYYLAEHREDITSNRTTYVSYNLYNKKYFD